MLRWSYYNQDVDKIMFSRRQFLKYSLIAGGTLATGVAFYTQIPTDEIAEKLLNAKLNFFTQDDEYVLMAIVPAILVGTQANSDMVVKVIQNMDSTIQTLPLKTQKELRELFDLLANKLARVTVASVWASWSSATNEEISQFLLSWQNSFIDLLQIGYQGLKQLTLGSYYAESNTWQQIGYSGFPKLI